MKGVLLDITQKVVYKTFDQICLDKLKEIGISTALEWSVAMGYMHRGSLAKIIKRIKSESPEKLKIYYNIKPRRYEAL